MLAMSKRTLMELMNDGELPTVRGRGNQGQSLRDDGGQGRPALHGRRQRLWVCRRHQIEVIANSRLARGFGMHSSQPRTVGC